METIKLRFVRPPNEVNVWTHDLLFKSDDVIVSKFIFSGLKVPSKVKDVIIVENGYTGICYEFLDRGLEIIKVLDTRNELSGYYCNINRNPKMFDGGYEVVDLFLDVWVFPDFEYVVLDEDEFENALKNGWINEKDGRFANSVLKTLLEDLNKGKFPPEIVKEIR
ncbi:MAG: DUF402 domain-containing protein [Thermoplasmata archaeon]|nr:DUF402 domain-containing protein [Thermoplasmata archaeon]